MLDRVRVGNLRWLAGHSRHGSENLGQPGGGRRKTRLRDLLAVVVIERRVRSAQLGDSLLVCEKVNDPTVFVMSICVPPVTRKACA